MYIIIQLLNINDNDFPKEYAFYMNIPIKYDDFQYEDMYILLILNKK